MRIFLLFICFLLGSSVLSQEKFLEVNHVLLNSEGKKIKDYQVGISTSEGITFVIKAKKKVSYYLPPGEYYTVVVSKDNFPTQTLIIDLLAVPENRYNARLHLPISLTLNSSQPIRYHYEERYGKVVRVVE